jgi:phosphatidylinositol glycan class U
MCSRVSWKNPAYQENITHADIFYSPVTSTHRYPFPALAALLYATLLGPAFHYLWLYAGSGNANFFYAITLVWNLALLILETDFVYAALRDEWEAERPEVAGKVARQI